MSEQQDSPAHADISWDEQGQPLSASFGDVYFSKANGLEETRHVFLTHNQLPERFAALDPGSDFIIGETGFGSGLNFLAAWDLWLKAAPISARLHFVSVEKYPLRKADLQRALALWPELKSLADELIQAYPAFAGKGFHRLKFMDGRISLTLIIEDAAVGFSQLLASTHPLFAASGTKINAWFLDGFAPSKNPQMWSDELFLQIRRLSAIGTTAATFSAAAIVKNGLKGASFAVEKVAGFGRKREMVKAIYNEQPEPLAPEDFVNRRSFSPYPSPWTIEKSKPVFVRKHALVIGGGLAGCHTARALAERGWRVTLVEQESALAQKGSGNPQGVLYAKLSPIDEAQGAFNLAALEYALHFYDPLWTKIGSQCGVLQLAHKAAEQALHEQLREKFELAPELVQFVSASQASGLAGTQLKTGGLYFPRAGWIDPRKLCHHLITHPNIQVKVATAVVSIQRVEKDWQLTTASGEQLAADALVIASASDAVKFAQANHLPVKAIRGQVTYLPASSTSPALNTVICAEGYVAPQQDSQFCTGATFNLKDADTELRLSDQLTNLENLRQHVPAFSEQPSPPVLAGRVGFRCTLPDYLPLIGPLPDPQQLIEDFAPLRKNARAGIATAGSYLPGLYINIGHGARGLAYTPLCAELLAAQINNEPMPVARDLVNALNPARFIIRDLVRNKI